MLPGREGGTARKIRFYERGVLMVKISKLLATAALATVLGAGASSAATYGTIPGSSATNEALGVSARTNLGLNDDLEGWYGANLWLTGSGPMTVTATLMGAEAGYENSFVMPGSDNGGILTDLAGNSSTPGDLWFDIAGKGTITKTGVTAGLLDFSFLANSGSASVSNGSNPDNTLSPNTSTGINFFASHGNGTDELVTDSSVVWLFFDDDGANNDDNHDDLVIRLSISGGPGGGPRINIVPVPAAGFLLIGALGGLAALRRRKKKVA